MALALVAGFSLWGPAGAAEPNAVCIVMKVTGETDPELPLREEVAANTVIKLGPGAELTFLAANVRRGVVPTPEAAQRFAEIDQGEHEVAAILGEYGKKSMASMQQYQAAFNQEAQQMNIPPNELMADAGPPPPSSGGRPSAPRPARPVSQNTRQMAQGYSKLNQQVSEINQEQSTIERTATARRNDMQALGVQVQG